MFDDVLKPLLWPSLTVYYYFKEASSGFQTLSTIADMSGMQDIQVGSTTTPPLISPVVVEGDGAEHFLGTVHNQFQPDTDQAGIAPPGNWPQISPVASIGSQTVLQTIHRFHN